MKKWLSMAVAVLAVLSLSGCGNSESGGNTNSNSSVTVSAPESSATESTAPTESVNEPYVLVADEWYQQHCSGASEMNYLNQRVKVSGTVLNISDYGDLKGYYLAGGTGQGLVCWADGGELKAQLGQRIEYVGTVVAEEPNHIEISDGEITNVENSTEKLKSPVTISDWSASRDSAGGVEWNFRLTNNTDKTIKYVWLEWNCYNAVGDLAYDEITGKTSHGVKYTGPLEGGQTTNLLCNTTLFYSYSFKSAKLKRFEVEYIDGTKIQITDTVYTDIMAG